MANFWEEAPIVSVPGQSGGNFWEAAPVVESFVGDANRGASSSSAMNFLTMGAMPKINAAGGSLIDSTIGAIQGEGFNFSDNYNKHLGQQRADQAAYEEQNPVKSTLAKTAGFAGGVAMLPALAPFKAAGAVPGMANAATTGAVYGGTAGAIQDANSIKERGLNTLKGGGTGAALGAAAYPVIRAISAGVGKILGNNGTPRPTTQQIKEQSQANYKLADSFGVRLEPQGYSNLVGKITDDIITPSRISEQLSGVTDTLAPASKKLVEGLQKTKGMDLSLEELHQIRTVASEIADQMVEGRPTKDAAMAMKILDHIDDFIDDLPNQPINVASGDAAAAVAARQEATAGWRQMIQSSTIDRAMNRAEINAATNYSQAGMAQAVQREFANLAKSPRFSRTFSPDQQKAIMAVVEGGPIEKLFRFFGKSAPSGGLSQMLHLGSALQSGGATVPLSIAASASQAGAASSKLNKADLVDALIKGGPGFKPKPGSSKIIEKMLMDAIGPGTGNAAVNRKQFIPDKIVRALQIR